MHAELYPMVEEMNQVNTNTNLVRVGAVLCLDKGDTRMELASAKGMSQELKFIIYCKKYKKT